MASPSTNSSHPLNSAISPCCPRGASLVWTLLALFSRHLNLPILTAYGYTVLLSSPQRPRPSLQSAPPPSSSYSSPPSPPLRLNWDLDLDPHQDTPIRFPLLFYCFPISFPELLPSQQSRPTHTHTHVERRIATMDFSHQYFAQAQPYQFMGIPPLTPSHSNSAGSDDFNTTSPPVSRIQTGIPFPTRAPNTHRSLVDCCLAYCDMHLHNHDRSGCLRRISQRPAALQQL